MVNRIIYSIAVLSFFMQCTPVQKDQVKSIQWEIAANLPAADGAEKAGGRDLVTKTTFNICPPLWRVFYFFIL